MKAAIWWGCLAFIAAVTMASAATTNVIYSLAGEDDGEYADTDLAIDTAGNLYGTTVLGGAFGSGTVFKLAPTPNGWVHTVLYSFTGGEDGGEPYKGVTLDAQGNLYGTAVTGGSGSCEGGCGVAYKLTNSGGTWTQTVIHAFTGGNDGSGPGARLTVDQQGNLYGMAPTGGAYAAGTIFRIAAGTWKFKVIHAFTGGADGSGGSAGQILLRGGHLYGAATVGGIYGKGVAFELTPAQTGEWTFKTIYSFKGPTDGPLSVHPPGEWNQYEITCKGDTVKLVVNGQLENEGTMAEITKGKILLQSEGAEIYFRNVELTPLK